MKSLFNSLVGDNECEKAITTFSSTLICLFGWVFLACVLSQKLSPNVPQVAHLSRSTATLEFGKERVVIDD